MATNFPTSIDSFGFTAAAGKAVPYDVLQRALDAIVAIETLLGAGSASSASFTPTIVSSGGGTPTYTVQVGRSRQFLGLVHVTGRVTLATFGSLAAGSVSIGGFPVVSANIGNLYSVAAVSWFALATSVVFMGGTIAPNTSGINLQHLTAAATSATVTQKSDLSATADFVFSAIYPAS